MSKKEFKAESKKLLDMMVNSIYTNKEIFIRELISNASDALDKRYYKSIQSGNTGIDRKDFCIEITPDKGDRTLKISDNGIGMTKEELENNLGTIAKSGSLSFKEKLKKEQSEEAKAADIIGQFGVGFYSAFMVTDRVEVLSKSQDSEEAYRWESSGAEGYEISVIDKDEVGTDVILHIKKDTENEDYSQYLEEFTIRNLIKKYSDFIRYPIKMMVTKSRPKEGQSFEDGKMPEMEEYRQLDTLNSMEPIWKRAKSEVTDEEYNTYYRMHFRDMHDPIRVIRTSVEGVSSYTALLFIPGEVPFNYYTKDFRKGLALYSSGVLIMEHCEDLLPDCFNFIKGLVDSQDVSLNISREMLQQDRQMRFIAKKLEKKIKSELLSFLKNDREGYEKFFDNFGRNLKFGIYDNFGEKKDLLSDLVLFYSSTEKKLITFDEYVEKMGENQKYIYYAPGETVEKIDMLPQVKVAKDKGMEILYLTDEMDEFVVKTLQTYKEKEFKSISNEDFVEDQTEEEKEKLEKLFSENAGLINLVKTVVGDSIEEVRFSTGLVGFPATITTKGEISLEMEKTLNRMPVNSGVKAQRVFELNPEHGAVKKLISSYKTGEEADNSQAERITRLLYNQALIVSGLDVKDPIEMGKDICELIMAE